ADVLARSLEIARLQAQIDKDWDSYQKRPRRTFVGARAQSYQLAQYVEDWRSKVERVGTLNYPEAARQQKLFGNLQLTVAIKADGSVEKVEIERSSGKKILDQAALRILDLAGPFAPLPPEVRKTTDILHITRTWTFTRSDQLFTQ
ncbi:MAG TPA: TonB family protein, partial [Burkholderiales bacterium]|nr:TonB family protein [Burkholderiales bacterium]